MPSEDILSGADVLEEVDDLFLTAETIYVDYVAEINEIIPSQALTALPINGSESSNILLNSSLTTIEGSNQPIFYEFNSSGDVIDIERFGPTRLAVTVSGATRSGKIKLAGETLKRIEVDVVAGISVDGLVFDMGPALKTYFNLTTIPPNIGIARVDSVISKDNSDTVIQLIGHKLKTNVYGFGVSEIDSSLTNVKFALPANENNNALSFSTGEILTVNMLVFNTSDIEELFFFSNGKVFSEKVFARLIKTSVSSGFRSPAGALVGSLVVNPTSQPGVGLSYSANYKFAAPVEGERITVRFNLNRLISDVTANLENVRSITADVLVKETPTISVNVQGQVIINEDVVNETQTILENVSNAVVNLLNSSTLGTTVDYSDIINAATSITGVDSVNVSVFNEAGSTGRRSFIRSLDNQAIIAGEVVFTAVARKDFRIT